MRTARSPWLAGALAALALALSACGESSTVEDAGTGGGTVSTGGGTASTGGGTVSTGGGTVSTGGGTASTGGGTASTGGGGGTTSTLDCSSCHTADALSGAHATHLAKGALAQAFKCADCHTLPTDATHQTQPITVTFGALASTGSSSPGWSAASGTCSNVYCHGAKSSGGTQPAVQWDGGASTVACGTCHGVAPTASSHVQTSVKYCSVCHTGINSSGLLNVDAGVHVNGAVDLKADAGHLDGWQPPGHNASIDFTTCLVCHPSGRSCSSCH